MPGFVIGRGEDCHVVLNATSVSRQHASLQLLRNGKIRFEDMDSTNGSYMLEGENLVRIRDTELPPEALLQIGKVRISMAEILRCLLVEVLRRGAQPNPHALAGSPMFQNLSNSAPR